MKKVYLSLIVLFFSICAQAQDVGIKHYQRKIDTFEFVLPTEPFSPKGLLIIIPDSLYSFGDIQIKKANFPSFTARNCSIYFEADTVKQVQFSIKGKKNKAKFLEILKSRIQNYSDELTQKNSPIEVKLLLAKGTELTYSTRSKGRKTWVKLSSKQ